jgi:hypothetical protein
MIDQQIAALVARAKRGGAVYISPIVTVATEEHENAGRISVGLHAHCLERDYEETVYFREFGPDFNDSAIAFARELGSRAVLVWTGGEA